MVVVSGLKQGKDVNKDGKSDIYYAGSLSHRDYYPFGGLMAGRTYMSGDYRFGFNGKENDNEVEGEGNSIDFGARIYDPRLGRFLSMDPLTMKYAEWSPYSAMANNPVMFLDADGREPVKSYIGTVEQFRALLDVSPRKVGLFTGQDAANYLKNLGNTEFSKKHIKLPTETAYFNTKVGRYIYTEKGGWVDMAHFMFYAGRAYQSRLRKEALEKVANNPNEHPSQRAKAQARADKINPIGEAVQEGYYQERIDDLGAATHSAFSYEDLPSDKYGAEFASKYFDPNSKLNFGQQLESYLNNVLCATDPCSAPNYEMLPEKDSTSHPPTVTNKTTNPMFTKEKK